MPSIKEKGPYPHLTAICKTPKIKSDDTRMLQLSAREVYQVKQVTIKDKNFLLDSFDISYGIPIFKRFITTTA